MDPAGQPLDEEIRAAIRMGGKDPAMLAELTPDKARALQRSMAEAFASPRAPVLATRDLSLPGAAGPLPARLYRPDTLRPPLIVFIHGGGWVGGDLDTHDQMCRLLGAGAGCAVLAITYRLAPEHPFPAAVEDCVAAVRWAARSAQALDCDPSRMAVFGESAGANLASVALLSLAGEPVPRFAFQCLAYPPTDLRLPTLDPDETADPLGLTPHEALWCRAQYITGERDLADWRASPILAPNLAALPPTHVITAGVDPLRSDGEAYAAALAAAGVPATCRDYPGLPHGFLSLPIEIPRVASAYADVYEVLRAGLGNEAASNRA